MRASNGQILSERKNRRRGWTAGRITILADGLPWTLPRIDPALLIASPGLQGDIVVACRLSAVAEQTQLDSVEMATAQAHLANTGHRLLQWNYDLPNEDWALLLNFTTLGGLTSFTHSVIQAIDTSRAIWLPFVKTFGPGGPGVSRVN